MRFPLLAKLAAIGLVVLLLMAVLMRIDGLVAERRLRQWQAAASVEQSLAEAQTLIGPLLQRRCTETWEGKEGTLKRELVLLQVPQALQGRADLRSETRYRGLFKVNGYVGMLEIDARWPAFGALQPQREHAGSRMACAPPRLWLAVGDVRGLRSVKAVLDGREAPVLPGAGSIVYPRGLHLDIDETRLAEGAPELAAHLSIELVGTRRLDLVPAATETAWTLRSDWPHPSFDGRFLPTTREVRADGFDARWAVSSLASSAANDVSAGAPVCGPMAAEGSDDGVPASAAKTSACLDTLGVAFIDPVNANVLTDRATKYSLLFIALTFAFVGTAEVVARRRVHPVQYTLVGLALALFFLLLLSLSEHIAFGAAYAAASAACVLLLGTYGRHMLGTPKAGAAFGAGVALLYAALWVLLRLEQTALVIGSLLLFAMLAAVMILTRRVDWYALTQQLSGTA